MACSDCAKNNVNIYHNCVRHSDCFLETETQWKPGNCDDCKSNFEKAKINKDEREKSSTRQEIVGSCQK